MASTDENPGLLARFYGSRQESSTRRKSAERPFPHNVQRGSTAASAAANCLYPDTTRGRRNVGRVAETLTSRALHTITGAARGVQPRRRPDPAPADLPAAVGWDRLGPGARGPRELWGRRSVSERRVDGVRVDVAGSATRDERSTTSCS